MKKSQELTDPKSCMVRAKDDEMTFVLLARDAAAPIAIHAWTQERIRLGKNTPDDPQIREATTCAEEMIRQRSGHTSAPPAPAKQADAAWHRREATLTTSPEATRWHREMAAQLEAKAMEPTPPAPAAPQPLRDALEQLVLYAKRSTVREIVQAGEAVETELGGKPMSTEWPVRKREAEEDEAWEVWEQAKNEEAQQGAPAAQDTAGQYLAKLQAEHGTVSPEAAMLAMLVQDLEAGLKARESIETLGQGLSRIAVVMEGYADLEKMRADIAEEKVARLQVERTRLLERLTHISFVITGNDAALIECNPKQIDASLKSYGSTLAEAEVARLEKERDVLREFAYASVMELEYVQCAEDHSQCASRMGKTLVEKGMQLLGVKDLSAETWGEVLRIRELEGGK